MSQFHPSQHGGDSDFQMWQQQMMYKQLQEFQRQQQLQQLDHGAHGARMQTSFEQFRAPAKPAPADQLPSLLNEMPTNEASSYTWSNNLAVGSSRLASNSQFLNTGNTNWDQFGGTPGTGNFINGSVYTSSQGLTRSMALAANRLDQSCPMPSSISRGSGNQSSQFLGFSANSQNAMAMAGAGQSDKASRFSSPFNSFQNEHGLREQGASNPLQSFRGNVGALSNSPMQSQGDDMQAGSPVLGNNLPHGFHIQDFHGRSNQVNFQSTLQVGPTSNGASLDPTEEKILFGNDENSNWGDLLRTGNSSAGAYEHGNSLGSSNFSSAFPSLQSGSWSALMQEALQSTSSNDGLREEWSSLNFQKTDQLVTSSSTLTGLEPKNLVSLNDANLQSASPQNAQPSPTCDDAVVTVNSPNFTSYQQATRTPYDQRKKLSHESPTATLTNRQSTAEASNRYVQQSLKQNQSNEYGGQEQINLQNGIWTQRKSELLKSISHSTGAHVMPHNAHGDWMSQQNTFSNNFSREPSNSQNDWSSNNPLGKDTNNTSNVFNGDGSFWKSTGVHSNSVGRIEEVKPDGNALLSPNDFFGGTTVGMMSKGMPMVNQNRYQMVIGRSSEKVGINHTMGRRVPETSEPPGNNAKEVSDGYNQEYCNAASNEGSISNHGQHFSSDFAARRNSFSGKDAENLGQPVQRKMGSHVLQDHVGGNSGMNIGHCPANSVSNTQFLSQLLQPPNNQEHPFGTYSQAAGNVASVNEKMSVEDEQLKSQHAIPNNYSSGSSFGGSDAILSQNRTVQTGQHMLQFLHKVDNSTNSGALAAGNMPNRSFDIATAHQQLNQPSLHGFGLKLGPPSQRQPTSGHLWPSHTSVDSKQPDHSASEEDQTQLPSTSSQSLPPGHSTRSTPFHTPEIDNTLPSGCFPQISSGHQYPVVQSRSASVPSMPQQPQQGGSATMFKNVWTNISAQRLAGVQPNKITPNILQSMMFPNNVGDSNLWGVSKVDDQRQKAEAPSDVTTSSANSQNQEAKQVVENDVKLTSSETVNVNHTGDIVSERKEPLQNHSMDGTLAQLHHPGIMNTKQRDNAAVSFQPVNASVINASSGIGIGLHGSPAPSNVEQQNYSLLHQMQTMKHVDFDPSNAFGKGLKTTDMGSDALQVDWKAGQRFPYGANSSVRLSTDNVGASGDPSSFSSDAKMLSFAPRNSEEKTPSMPSQLHSREESSDDMVITQNDLQSQVPSLGTSSNLVERSDRPSVNPQMAPSWFGQQASYRNGQTLAIYNTQKDTTPNFPKVSWSMGSYCAVEHRLDSGHSVRSGQYMSSTSLELLQMPSTMKASSMVKRPKKRKFAALAPVSWTKIVEGCQKLGNMSMADMDWARAANRLIEKVEEAEILEDSPINNSPRKRLILTTRLIQQLFPAIPPKILRAKDASVYESATYTLSKLTIGHACSMASITSGNSCTPINNENNSSEQTKTTEKIEEKLSKAVEVFIGRFKKMEHDFVSLNKRAPMLDVQLECQDLERISIVNRLGRFHGRNHSGGVEGSSTSEIAPRRIFPERHVMSFAVPGNLPEGVFCLSL